MWGSSVKEERRPVKWEERTQQPTHQRPTSQRPNNEAIKITNMEWQRRYALQTQSSAYVPHICYGFPTSHGETATCQEMTKVSWSCRFNSSQAHPISITICGAEYMCSTVINTVNVSSLSVGDVAVLERRRSIPPSVCHPWHKQLSFTCRIGEESHMTKERSPISSAPLSQASHIFPLCIGLWSKPVLSSRRNEHTKLGKCTPTDSMGSQRATAKQQLVKR